MSTKTLESTLVAHNIIDEIERALGDTKTKLEFVNGLHIWEASPVYSHQIKTLDIQVSILGFAKQNGCACIPVADTTILFADGSYKRPDISVFCGVPRVQNRAVTTMPDAVIEIVSVGYEKKDYEIGLPFYLAHGIPDIVIFDPATNRVSHYAGGEARIFDSPVELSFACGCRARI